MMKTEWTEEELLIREKLRAVRDEDENAFEIPSPDFDFMTVDKSTRKAYYGGPRVLKVAAVIILMLMSSMVTSIFISNEYAEAFKEEVDKNVVKTHSGVVVSDDAESGLVSEVWEITDPKLEGKLKDAFAEYKSLDYIPNGYEFEKIAISNESDETYSIEHTYKNGDDYLKVRQLPVDDDTMVNAPTNEGVMEMDDRTIALWNDVENEILGCTVVFDDVSVVVSSNALATDELIKIGKGIY